MIIGKTPFYPEFFAEGIKELFFNVLEAPIPQQHTAFTSYFKSTKDKENYAFLGNIGEPREFLDERVMTNITAKWTYEVVNKKWELTTGIRRDELEDEQYGEIARRIGQLARESARFHEKKAFDMLVNGGTYTCFDGKTFFADDHDLGTGNQDNNLALALSSANVKTAIAAMRAFVDDRGRNLGIEPNLMVVGPSLAFTAMELLNASSYVVTKQESAGTPAVLTPDINVLKGSLNLLVSNYITSATAWYLMDTTKDIKPVIVQSRTPLEFAALDQPTSTEGFDKDIYKYGTRERFGIGYGPWMYCLRGNA